MGTKRYLYWIGEIFVRQVKIWHRDAEGKTLAVGRVLGKRFSCWLIALANFKIGFLRDFASCFTVD